MVTASTEEGLSAVTERYLAHEGGDPILTRASLRWSPSDSPIHKEGESLLAKSEQLRAEGPAPYEDSVEADQAIALVFDSSVDVLRQLDSEKLFGTGFDRSQLVLGVWMGDQSDEERTEFVRQLNSAAVAVDSRKN